MYKLTRMEAETIRRTDQADSDIHDLGKNANRLYIHACRNPNLWDKYGDNRKYVLVFLDGILTYSEYEEKHVEQLRLILIWSGSISYMQC